MTSTQSSPTSWCQPFPADRAGQSATEDGLAAMEQTAYRKEDVLLFVPNLIGQIFFLVSIDFSPMRSPSVLQKVR